jgi:hypothetical protein
MEGRVNNVLPAHYRSVSVADVDVDLTDRALTSLLAGREAYRKTTYIIARRGPAAAVIKVTKASDTELFSPIRSLELLAGPEDCVLVDSPETDVGIPTQMSRCAASLAPGARCVVVTGRYRHINFILDPKPIVVRVVEVAPPIPAKLVDQAQRILDVAEELPPIELHPEIVDLIALASTQPASRYLFPCRGSGAAPPGAEVSYLDQRPPRQPWVLVGCARSRQFHRWFYGDAALGGGEDNVANVEICPRELAARSTVPTLTKCCLLEEGIVQEGSRVVVPWGACLAEVREGLALVARISEPAWPPA